MTQKMIQIDVDEMKKELKALTGYYGSSRTIEREYHEIANFIDKGNQISAYRQLEKLQDKMKVHYESIKRLRDMLIDAGCVLD